MDTTSERAIADYEALLRDDAALAAELEERFLERMRARRLTFGDRVLCTCPRPNLVSASDYDEIRAVCRGILAAVEKAERSLGAGLWDRVGVRPEERELVAIDPGYGRSAPLSRLDSFLTPSSYQFVELNAETPAGASYADVLAEAFLELPLVQRFQERWRLRRFHSGARLLATLLRCYRDAGGREAAPTIAVVDYDEVPTRVEHHLVREAFEARGIPTLVCDPRRLEFAGGKLRHQGRTIDVVYKRLLVNELLDRQQELGALLRAVREHAVVVVNPFRCKPLHKKAIFAVLTDDALQPLFTPAERDAIASHVPWTRRLVEGRTTRRGQPIDLPRYVVDHREELVMKPNDEYGGKGVVIGRETTDGDWTRALDEALRSSWVVQDRVEVLRQRFPQVLANGGGPGGRLELRDFVVDLDPYAFDGEVEGFLTRLSTSSLANVTSGGGQVPSFVVEPRE
jgi:uncharacterized circularly permuted ATP-grasp superfamily protein